MQTCFCPKKLRTYLRNPCTRVPWLHFWLSQALIFLNEQSFNKCLYVLLWTSFETYKLLRCQKEVNTPCRVANRALFPEYCARVKALCDRASSQTKYFQFAFLIATTHVELNAQSASIALRYEDECDILRGNYHYICDAKQLALPPPNTFQYERH